MRWSILQHSDHSGGDPAFIVALAGGTSTSPLPTSPSKLLRHHQALAGGTSTSPLPTSPLKLLRHHQALAGGTSTSPLPTTPLKLLRHHQALAGGTSTSPLLAGQKLRHLSRSKLSHSSRVVRRLPNIPRTRFLQNASIVL